jgi:hypothetical protein
MGISPVAQPGGQAGKTRREAEKPVWLDEKQISDTSA